jgi:hypothetical protein
MTQFKKYMHIEKWGNTEVEGIEIGDCYIFSKIDGTLSSIWVDDYGKLCAGSKNRQLTLENDNRGFYKYILEKESNESIFHNFFIDFPNYILYAEYLVPHTLKTYRDDAWNKYYVFDVYDTERECYIHYWDYKPILNSFDIEYIPCQKIIRNPTLEVLEIEMNNNTYLMKQGEIGEGIVIKNYQFVNRFGRITWAKLVRSEFREKHLKSFNSPKLTGDKKIEDKIVELFITETLVEKTYAKIKNDNDGWSSKNIPELLNRVYYDLIREEIWEILKKFKNPTIDFKLLKKFTDMKIKEIKTELF